MPLPRTCPQCGAAYAADQRFCALDGAALRGDPANGSLIGEVLAERYHVQERLGEGGMGEVYRAEHVRMGRACAVKVLRPAIAADPDAVSRFNREAANASRVAHPNVAAIYDFGETADGVIYLAMELVDGRPLRALLDESGALPPPRALGIVSQIAGALDAAHALGIVHRDLKPDNVMLARAADGTDVVKVVDFGIAKGGDAPAQAVTRTGLIVGTPEYMSPEQLAGDPLDGRSDVYALGLLAYTMLTGAHAFPAETVQDTLVLRLTAAPRRLADVRPDVGWPTAVQSVLDRGLARRAEERTPSAGEFARTLACAFEHAAMDGAPAAISPDGATQILPASVVALPATRVASARVGSRRRFGGPAAIVAGLALAGALGAAAWRGGAISDGAGSLASPTSPPAMTPAAPAAEPATIVATDGAPQGAQDDATVSPYTRTARRDAAAGAGSGPARTDGAHAVPTAAPAFDPPSRDAGTSVRSPSGPDADARIVAAERLLQSDASMDPVAVATALRGAEAAARDATPGTRAWDRAQVSRALALYALEDARWCEVARAVPPSRARAAVLDGVIRTLFEQIRTTECVAARVRADSGVNRP